MFCLTKKRVAFAALVASAASSATAFQPKPITGLAKSKTSLNMVGAVDPSTVTKKDYEDICGVSFDEASMMDRLRSTNFLYPKHVEVIEDIAPLAGEMVDTYVRVTDGIGWSVFCGSLANKLFSCSFRFLSSALRDRREGVAASRLPSRYV